MIVSICPFTEDMYVQYENYAEQYCGNQNACYGESEELDEKMGYQIGYSSGGRSNVIDVGRIENECLPLFNITKVVRTSTI